MNMNVQRPEGVELRAHEDLPSEPTVADFVSPDTMSWRRLSVYAALAGGAGYFVATASATTLLVTAGIVAGLLGLLVACGVWVQNNAHGC